MASNGFYTRKTTRMNDALHRIGVCRDRLDALEDHPDEGLRHAAELDLEAAYLALTEATRLRPPWTGFSRVPRRKRTLAEARRGL